MEKIYAISDLHVDQTQNMQWVEQLSKDKYLNDTVIIAGDVTHVLSKLRYTLRLFKLKFQDVYYCPGNHELWTQSQTEDAELSVYNSIDKFHSVLKVCDDLGVRTRPGVTNQGITIVPLFGWYDESLHFYNAHLVSDLQLWTDCHLCKWPDSVPQTEAAKYFTDLNEQYLDELSQLDSNSKIITFSHFFTSKAMMKAYVNEMTSRRQKWLDSVSSETRRAEEKRGTSKTNFSLVAGTELLDRQLKMIKPAVHVFGHSHRKMVLDIGDGIKYINNPLGYITERDRGLIEGPHELHEIILIDE